MSNEGDQNLSEGARAFLQTAHPAHVEYLRDVPVNTLEYFFSVIGRLDSEEHADIIMHLFLYSLPDMGSDPAGKRFNVPAVNRESVAAFTERCRRAARVISEPAVIIGLVTGTLSQLYRLGDVTAVEATKSRLMRMGEMGMRGELGDAGPEADSAMDWLVNHMENLPEKAERAHALYVYFCENVVQRLIEQSPFSGSQGGA